MLPSFRSGNSRTLAKTLDQLGHPLAVLDRRGALAFVNAAMCAMAGADATQLVGRQCSWQIASDDTPFAAILTALAPPAGTLKGKIVARQLSLPIVFGSTETGQLFIPLLDNEGAVEATLVVLGRWQEILAQVPQPDFAAAQRTRNECLVQIRSRWPTLDGLHALLGRSPAMQLAMTRAQLALTECCSLMITGPRWIGKTQLVQGVFISRLKKAGLPKIAGQLFPLACDILEAELFEGMLDVFTDRFRDNIPRVARLLVLEQFDKLTPAAVKKLLDWLESYGSQCEVAAITQVSADELSRRSPLWQKLIAIVAAIEIVLPPLRERREDIETLASHLLAAACQSKGRANLTFSDEALQLLIAFPWPENLSQLAQAIDEAVNHAVLATAIQVNHLPVAIRTFASTVAQAKATHVEPIDLDQVLQELERIMLARALKLSPRNRAQAARWLGISRPRLLRRIEQLGLAEIPSSASENEIEIDNETNPGT